MIHPLKFCRKNVIEIVKKICYIKYINLYFGVNNATIRHKSDFC